MNNETVQQSVGWIQTHSKSLTPQLNEFKAIVGKARIVGLGESTHGTKEFYQLKLELIKKLIDEMNFSVVALEAGVVEVGQVNQYLQDGSRDLSLLLKNLGGVFRTQQVLDLIRWMRKFNLEHSKQVSIVGCDIQNPNFAIKNIRVFIQDNSPKSLPQVESDLSLVKTTFSKFYKIGISAEEKQSAVNAANHIFSIINALPVSKESSWILHNGEVIVQGTQLLTKNVDEVLLVRDHYMAENFLWEWNRLKGQSKMILWAHIGHVAKDYVSRSMAIPSMTSYLEKEFGEKMVSVGLFFHQGSYLAGVMGSTSLPPAPYVQDL